VPPGAVEHRLFLIGDSGDPDPAGEPVLDALEARVQAAPQQTTVVFLGDLVYETGMPEPSPIEGTAVEDVLDEVLLNAFESRSDAERRVKAQVKAADFPGTRQILIPGNHDWDQFGSGGWASVQRLGAHLETVRGLAAATVDFLPGGGCPGPVAVDVGASVRLIVVDTQWFLELGKRPTPDDNPTGCPYTTEDDVLAALVQDLKAAKAANRTAIVVGHHPLRSRGPHGGWLQPHVHLFPFTMLGSYVPFFVRWFPLPGLGTLMVEARTRRSPSPQDFSFPDNERMRTRLAAAMQEAAASGAAPLAYAAGHEHSLQVFEGDDEGGLPYLLVSGLGSHSKASGVYHDATTLYAHSNPVGGGFMQLDVLRDGRIRLAVIEVMPGAAKEGVEVYSLILRDGASASAKRRPA